MEFRMKKSVEALGPRWSRTRDRGATAVVIALCLLLVMAAAAMSFDTANLALQRQTLRNVTDAAAQAGASYLPGDPASAIAAVTAYAHRYDPNLNPTATLYCVVGSTGATMQPATGYIPATCNPGGSGTYTNGVAGTICDQNLCAIKCILTGINPVCNTLRVDANEDVPFYFAPAIGINKGNTGAITSVSCKGSCGLLAPNPMDVAIVADRTASLASDTFSGMQTGITDMLATMTPEYQFVTIGAIHKSTTKGTCETYLADNTASQPTNGASRVGNWMTSTFSADYLTGNLTSQTRALNPSSKVVNNVTCMNQGNQPWGTHLAAPMKAAARMLLNPSLSNLGSLTTTRAKLLDPKAVVKKVLIMETDGVPEETEGFNGYLVGNSGTKYTDTNTSKGNTGLGDNIDPTAANPSSGDVGCKNLSAVATAAKLAGIIVIMIGYGDANTAKCKKNYTTNPPTFSGSNVDDVMAAAASDGNNGQVSKADHDCTKTQGAIDENGDGDNYFCAASASQLSSIFGMAMNQLSTHTKFIKMPGN